MARSPALLAIPLCCAVSSSAFAKPDPHLVPDGAPVHLGVSLKVSDPEGLRRLLAAQRDPASPSYHAWLDPASFAERFGASDSDYSAVADWFVAHGFRVTRAPNRLFLEVVGRVDTLRGALGVQQRFSEPVGPRFRPTFRTFREPLRLPTEFADRVLHISGLDTRLHHRRRLTVPFNGSPTLVLGPDDLRLQYGLTTLLASAAPAECASGQASLASCYTTVVLDGQEGTATGDAETCVESSAGPPFIPPSSAAIAAYFSLAKATAAYDPIVLPNPSDDFDICGSNEESQLDVEMQAVGASNAASIDLVLSPASQVFTVGAQYIVNQIPKAVAVSLSIGDCEADEDGPENGGGPTTSGSLMQSLQQTVQQGLAEGQMWFASSGDTGADDCYNSTSGTSNGFGGFNATVDFPASMPEIVAVGGTQFSGAATWSSSGALAASAPEVVWNELETTPALPGAGAGGGGQSRDYTKPDYQSGIGPDAADGRRDVPDISLTGAAATPGVAIYDCGAGQDQTCAADAPGPTSSGSAAIFGGTSVSSPLAAGIFAQIAAVVGCHQGDIHATLYKLGKAQQGGGPAVFHDITSGDNSFVDPVGQHIGGFPAASGYDLATGWGTVDATALAANWPSCGPQGTTKGGCGTAGGTGSLLPLGLILLSVRRRARKR